MWDAFKDAIFICIEFFYNFVHDWGLAIVIVTLIFRLILFPLMQKQIKSTFQMQKFSPLMQEIQTKYADDKQRQSAEMQKLYAESGFNPLAGCLPMILQMPIFIALFQVLYDMNTRTGGSEYTFYNILPNLVASPANAWSVGVGPFIPYGILLIVFAGATFLPTLLQQKGTNNPAEESADLHDGHHDAHDALDRLGLSCRRVVILGYFFSFCGRAAADHAQYSSTQGSRA